MSKDSNEKIACKLVLLGKTAVGKTSCVLRYHKNMYEEFQQSTQGASYFEKNIQIENNVLIRLQIWDTAGQERYKSLTPMYYRDSNCALIVYDITDYDSFKTTQKWVKNIQMECRDAVISLIGNKLDLIEAGESRCIPQKEIEEFIEENNLLHFEVSAKTGKSVNEAFEKTVQTFYKFYRQNDFENRPISKSISINDVSKNRKDDLNQSGDGSCC
eukprot:gene9035-1133_t